MKFSYEQERDIEIEIGRLFQEKRVSRLKMWTHDFPACQASCPIQLIAWHSVAMPFLVFHSLVFCFFFCSHSKFNSKSQHRPLVSSLKLKSIDWFWFFIDFWVFLTESANCSFFSFLKTKRRWCSSTYVRNRFSRQFVNEFIQNGISRYGKIKSFIC